MRSHGSNQDIAWIYLHVSFAIPHAMSSLTSKSTAWRCIFLPIICPKAKYFQWCNMPCCFISGFYNFHIQSFHLFYDFTNFDHPYFQPSCLAWRVLFFLVCPHKTTSLSPWSFKIVCFALSPASLCHFKSPISSTKHKGWDGREKGRLGKLGDWYCENMNVLIIIWMVDPLIYYSHPLIF